MRAKQMTETDDRPALQTEEDMLRWPRGSWTALWENGQKRFCVPSLVQGGDVRLNYVHRCSRCSSTCSLSLPSWLKTGFSEPPAWSFKTVVFQAFSISMTTQATSKTCFGMNNDNTVGRKISVSMHARRPELASAWPRWLWRLPARRNAPTNDC